MPHITGKGMVMVFMLLAVCNTVQAQQILCPANLDFEDGSFQNWELYIGDNNAGVINTPTLSGPVQNRHTLKFGIDFDIYGGFPIVAPGGGMYSFKLGNDDALHEAERARYYVHVPQGPNAYTLIYRYAVVFQDPSHAPFEQPRFEVNVYDSTTGTPINCNHHLYVATSNLPGFRKSNIGTDVYYKDWTTATIDLSGFGGRTVAIDFTTADCSRGGHFGYGYFDISCSFFQIYNINCHPTAKINLKAPPGFQAYKWMDTTFTTTYGFAEQISVSTPPKTTRYAVILTPYAGFGCPDTLFTTVTRQQLITEVPPDTVICDSSVANLYVHSDSYGTPLTYKWSPDKDLSCSNCANPVASPHKTTRYYVTVTDTAGCSQLDSVNVTVVESVFPEITSDKDTVCQYESLNVSCDGKNPPSAAYTWNVDSSGKILIGDIKPHMTAYWAGNGKQHVILTIDNKGCVERDTIEIFVKENPDAALSFPPYACINEAVYLKPVQQPFRFKWKIDEQLITDSVYKGEYKLSWSLPGRKAIHLALDALNGCTNKNDTFINIYDKPVADIHSDVTDLCSGKKFRLFTEEGSRCNYSWNPPQYFTDNNKPEVHGIAEKTGYIYLAVINQWQCTGIDSFYIFAGPCCEVFMPDAFTPDNDGINDRYNPVDMERHKLTRFMIVNRWGQVVYETNALDKGWNGNHNGSPAPIGTYAYYLTYICNEGNALEKKGNFLLIR